MTFFVIYVVQSGYKRGVGPGHPPGHYLRWHQKQKIAIERHLWVGRWWASNQIVSFELPRTSTRRCTPLFPIEEKCLQISQISQIEKNERRLCYDHEQETRIC